MDEEATRREMISLRGKWQKLVCGVGVGGGGGRSWCGWGGGRGNPMNDIAPDLAPGHQKRTFEDTRGLVPSSTKLIRRWLEACMSECVDFF